MFWPKKDTVNRAEHEELQESVEILARATAENVETNALVFDVLGRLVDNVTQLKQENLRLRQAIEAQLVILERLTEDSEKTRRLLDNQDKRWVRLNERLTERGLTQLREDVFKWQQDSAQQTESHLVQRIDEQFAEQNSLFEQLVRVLKQPTTPLLDSGEIGRGKPKSK